MDFHGNLLHWPELNDKFYNGVHIVFSMIVYELTIKKRFRGEREKKSIKTGEANGHFYATALKVLKRTLRTPSLYHI